jgi:hypothetical protein
VIYSQELCQEGGTPKSTIVTAPENALNQRPGNGITPPRVSLLTSHTAVEESVSFPARQCTAHTQFTLPLPHPHHSDEAV